MDSRYVARSIAMAALFAALASAANASITLQFFPASDFNTNTAAMNATLGVAGDTIDTFSSTTLLPGLTITLAGYGVTTPTTLTALGGLYNQNTNGCGTLGTASWTGDYAVINTVSNAPISCTSGTNASQTITFNYAPGTTQFGIGLGNFQSTNSPSFPITNHELFVNGTDMGTIETLAGTNWTPGLALNSYLVVTASGGSSITSVGIENLTGQDVIGFSDLAVAAVPLPAAVWALLSGLGTLGIVGRRRRAV